MAGRDSNTARKGRSLGPASRQLDLAATLAAKGPGALQPQHLRFRRQPQGRKTLHLVLLDQSASMLRGQKLAWAKEGAKVMHPGPMNRGVEIDSDVADDLDVSLIQDQVEMGVAARMAVLASLSARWGDAR